MGVLGRKKFLASAMVSSAGGIIGDKKEANVDAIWFVSPTKGVTREKIKL